MRHFIKKKWFPLIIGVMILLLVGVIMALLGFRITYAPKLETSWDAVSAVAAWVGVLVAIMSTVASFLAIWFAIQIPKKIADRQDKIALFEKRYECFQTFEKCHILYVNLKEKHCTVEELRQLTKYVFTKPNWEGVTKEALEEEILRYEYSIHQMEFLFPDITAEDANQLYIHVKDVLWTIFADKFDHKVMQQDRDKYVTYMKNFICKYAETMLNSLKI